MIVLVKWLVPTMLVAFGLTVAKNAWVAVLAYHVWIVLALASRRLPVVRLTVPTHVEHRGFRRAITMALALMPAVVFAALTLLGHLQLIPNPALRIGDVGLANAMILPFAFYLCVFNGTFEELYWRTKGPPASRRVGLSDGLYALFHIPVLSLYWPLALALVAMLLLTAAGLLWRISIGTWGGRVWPAIASHVGCNIAFWLWLWTHFA